MQLRFFFAAPLLVATLGFSVLANAMNLNDASVLLPLPTDADFAQLLSPADQGVGGPLVPQATFTKFGRFIQGYPSADLYARGFKVLGVRFDPCFTEGVGPQACRHQIRLVWQPLIAANGNYATLDTALHSFYEFKEEQEWQAIKSAWPQTAPSSVKLQVHPQIKAETLNGAFWKQLKSVILSHCGEEKLVRLTAMSSNATSVTGEPAIVWLFQGFDIAGQVPTRMQIPRIGRSAQVLINTDTTHQDYKGDIQPAPPAAEWNQFLSDSAGASGDVKPVMDQAFAIENPKLENTGTMDCVSCHVAQDVRHLGEARFAQSWNWIQDFPTRYLSNQNLKNGTPVFGTNHVRSFGYFGQDPVISQRLINETAAIVRQL